jgi:hypothetical protein
MLDIGLISDNEYMTQQYHLRFHRHTKKQLNLLMNKNGFYTSRSHFPMLVLIAGQHFLPDRSYARSRNLLENPNISLDCVVRV